MFTNNEVIQLALQYARKYDNNINNLINDLDIKVNKISLDNLYGFTVNVNDKDNIYINHNDNSTYMDYIMTHEVAHVLLHDGNSRMFTTIINSKDKEELQANLFATIFLGYQYQDCDKDNVIQKIINYIHCNYRICDFSKLKY